jgi:hypothetical protein
VRAKAGQSIKYHASLSSLKHIEFKAYSAFKEPFMFKKLNSFKQADDPSLNEIFLSVKEQAALLDRGLKNTKTDTIRKK